MKLRGRLRAQLAVGTRALLPRISSVCVPACLSTLTLPLYSGRLLERPVGFIREGGAGGLVRDLGKKRRGKEKKKEREGKERERKNTHILFGLVATIVVDSNPELRPSCVREDAVAAVRRSSPARPCISVLISASEVNCVSEY